jgi:hypothetical protein
MKVTKLFRQRREQFIDNVSFQWNMTQISFGFIHFDQFAFKYLS